LLGGVAGATGTTSSQEGVIDPKADAALRRMSDYTGKLQSFRVDATTVDEKITKDGHKVQAVQQQAITVKRPGQMKVDRLGPNGHATLIDDGKQLSLYNSDKQVYATSPAKPDLEASVDEVRSKLNVDAPGADLFAPNSYAILTDGLQQGRYIGLEPIDGVMAHHIAVTKGDTDWQIWIKDGPDAVPLRFVITSKDMNGQPQFTTELRNWQLNPMVPSSTFAFAPPAGARRVEMQRPKQQQQQQGGAQ
jgi:hypothetical protein